MQLYFVYENHPNNRARIHKAECRYPNDGQGTPGHSPYNGTWHGPFGRDFAFQKLVQLGKEDTGACSLCFP